MEAPGAPVTPVEVELTDIVVRQSAKVLLFRFFLAELIFAAVLIVFLFFLRAFSFGTNLPATYFIDLIIIFIVFFDILVRGAVILLVLSAWIDHTYIFKRDRLILRRGVLSSSDTEINYALITTVDIRQSFFGGLLNYGTLVLTVSGKGEIDIADIPDPQKYADLLKGILPFRERLEIGLKKGGPGEEEKTEERGPFKETSENITSRPKK